MPRGNATTKGRLLHHQPRNQLTTVVASELSMRRVTDGVSRAPIAGSDVDSPDHVGRFFDVAIDREGSELKTRTRIGGNVRGNPSYGGSRDLLTMEILVVT